MKLTAIIMAGGKGERLWPRSRDKFPKQFLEMIPDKGTLLQQSVSRISPLVNINDVFIVTGKSYISIVQKQLPNLPIENILCEPIGRNTSPAIEFASIAIKNKYKSEDIISFVLPSDHIILDTDNFISTLKHAANLAELGNLVTLGINPTGPDTGYGYIKVVPNTDDVEKFVEKPSLDKAIEYIKDGHYYWNSGMFIWKISSILDAFNKYMPEQHQKFISLQGTSIKESESIISTFYQTLESISIDYAVMEKANNVKVIKSDFKWDDVGSWLSLSRINKVDNNKNYIEGNALVLDSKNSIVSSKDKLIAVLGIDNIVVVDTEDATLITTKDKLKDIKNIRKNLKDNRYL